jgi:hypothetical protein
MHYFYSYHKDMGPKPHRCRLRLRNHYARRFLQHHGGDFWILWRCYIDYGLQNLFEPGRVYLPTRSLADKISGNSIRLWVSYKLL